MTEAKAKHDAPFIYVACPWTPKGGGMFKVADYLIQSQGTTRASEDAELKPLDTRGGYSAAFSAWVMTTALAKLAGGRISGRLKGVHVNMAERLSLFRKGTIIAACRALGVPVVLHLHAAQLHHYYRSLPGPLKAMTRRFFAIADHVVVLGHTAQGFVVNELGLPLEKVEIVINGVPPPSMGRRVRMKGTPYRIYFLGNLMERKGVSDLLRAIAEAKFPAGAVETHFAGGGDVAAYEALAQDLGIAKSVHFVGWADQAKAARLMADADVLVLPSYDEGLPLVILEALANGVAVICTPVGEIPSVLTDGDTAAFVKPGDVPGIAACLHKVLDDDATREKLERNGRALYERAFSMSRFFANVAQIHKTHFGFSAPPAASSSELRRAHA